MAILSTEERATLLEVANYVACILTKRALDGQAASMYGPQFVEALRRIAGPDHDANNAADLAQTAEALSPDRPS